MIRGALTALSVITALAACAPHGEGIPDPAMNTFASALGVDLSRMTKTPSSLYFLNEQVGSGPEARTGQRVSVHYTGWLPDGSKFDSSRDRNQPFEFALGAGKVIAGWDEGVAGMKVGGRRKLVIPAELGYGARAMGPIPPNSTLVFDVELLAVR